MLDHRKNDSRDASSISLTRCVEPAARSAGSYSDAVQERRAHENAGDTGFDTGLEVSLFLARLSEELERRREILGIDGAAKRALRERREDPFGARRLVGLRLRLADENPLAARSRAHAGRVVRPYDARGLESRQTRRIVGFLRGAQRRLPNVLLDGRTLDPGEADFVRAPR